MLWIIVLLTLSSCTKKDPNLLWSEEFDTGTLNPDIWGKTPIGASDWNNTMSPQEDLYEVSGGTLKLRVRPNTSTPTDSASFVTGGVWTKGKVGFHKGRLEVRARYDEHQGFWPAIWLLGAVSDSWPMGGEIDLLEHLNSDSVFYSTVHTQYTLDGNEEPKKFATHGFMKGDFNLYSVTVGTRSVTFAVNGEEFFSYPRLEPAEEYQFPFPNHPFYLILSAQMGGSWVGDPAPITEPLLLEVDYIRYYRTDEGGEVVTL